jgi:hypothetical protein
MNDIKQSGRRVIGIALASAAIAWGQAAAAPTAHYSDSDPGHTGPRYSDADPMFVRLRVWQDWHWYSCKDLLGAAVSAAAGIPSAPSLSEVAAWIAAYPPLVAAPDPYLTTRLGADARALCEDEVGGADYALPGLGDVVIRAWTALQGPGDPNATPASK